MSSQVHHTSDQLQFGRRLRALRLARGMSQAELAGTEISATYLSRLESGARPPTERVLSHLCDQLGVTPAAFQPSTGSTLARALATVTTLGEAPEAASVLEEALQQPSEDDDLALRWQVQWVLARAYHAQGRSAEEFRLLEQLTELSDEIGLPELRVRSRTQLARRERSAGNLVSALARAGDAVSLAESLGHPHHLMEATLVLISIEAESGRLAEARARADQLLGSLGDHVPVKARVEALWTAATVRGRQGEGPAAIEAMQAAIAQPVGSEDPTLWLRLRLAAASLYLQLDPRDTERARQHLDEAGSAVELISMPPLHQRELWFLQCQLAYYEGRLDTARDLSERLGERPEGLGRRDLVRLQLLRHRIAISGGDRTAVSEMKSLATRAQQSGDADLAAEAWRGLVESLTPPTDDPDHG
ncbi:helix-turn-helix domain-containing protein [Streptomyces anulatus]